MSYNPLLLIPYDCWNNHITCRLDIKDVVSLTLADKGLYCYLPLTVTKCDIATLGPFTAPIRKGTTLGELKCIARCTNLREISLYIDKTHDFNIQTNATTLDPTPVDWKEAFDERFCSNDWISQLIEILQSQSSILQILSIEGEFTGWERRRFSIIESKRLTPIGLVARLPPSFTNLRILKIKNVACPIDYDRFTKSPLMELHIEGGYAHQKYRTRIEAIHLFRNRSQMNQEEVLCCYPAYFLLDMVTLKHLTLDGAGYIFPPNVHNLKNLRTFVFRHLHLSMIQDEDTQEIKLLNGSQSHIYNAWHIVDNFPTTLTHATLPVDEIYEKYYLTMYHHPQAYEAMLSNLEILSITPSYHRHTYDLYKDLTFTSFKNLKGLLWCEGYYVCTLNTFLETTNMYAEIPNLEYLRIPVVVDLADRVCNKYNHLQYPIGETRLAVLVLLEVLSKYRDCVGWKSFNPNLNIDLFIDIRFNIGDIGILSGPETLDWPKDLNHQLNHLYSSLNLPNLSIYTSGEWYNINSNDGSIDSGADLIPLLIQETCTRPILRRSKMCFTKPYDELLGMKFPTVTCLDTIKLLAGGNY